MTWCLGWTVELGNTKRWVLWKKPKNIRFKPVFARTCQNLPFLIYKYLCYICMYCILYIRMPASWLAGAAAFNSNLPSQGTVAQTHHRCLVGVETNASCYRDWPCIFTRIFRSKFHLLAPVTITLKTRVCVPSWNTVLLGLQCQNIYYRITYMKLQPGERSAKLQIQNVI